MDRIKVMVNGVPGDVAVNLTKHIINDNRFELIAMSLTGPEIRQTEHIIDSAAISLIQPDKRESAINKIKGKYKTFISIDFTHPSAVNGNAEFYCNNLLPFVMGTTGGDRKLLEKTIGSSSIPAVIAPNMAKQIVGIQAMLEWGAMNFPDLFNKYSLNIKESHQSNKADTSGTARAMATCFNKLGVSFSEKDIVKERDPGIQADVWKIPEEHLKGHGWHTYTLLSNDKTALFEFKHNINGRDIYAMGTLDAIIFLENKIKAGEKGKVFTMIDVLKGAN